MSKYIRKTIRLNDEEIDLINEKMSKLNMTSYSQYIRHMSLYGFIVNRDSSQLMLLLDEYTLLKRELKSIGVNINQIAKRLNSSEVVYKDDVIEIKNKIENICLNVDKSLDKAVKNY